MAEDKRFISDIHRICDNDEEIACADTMDDAEILVDRLNKQDNQIKGLEKRNEILLQILRELEKENKRLKQGKYIYGVHGGSNDRK